MTFPALQPSLSTSNRRFILFSFNVKHLWNYNYNELQCFQHPVFDSNWKTLNLFRLPDLPSSLDPHSSCSSSILPFYHPHELVSLGTSFTSPNPSLFTLTVNSSYPFKVLPLTPILWFDFLLYQPFLSLTATGVVPMISPLFIAALLHIAFPSDSFPNS